MGKRTSEFMRSVHIKTIRAGLQQGKTVLDAEQHLRSVGVCEEELVDLLLEAGYCLEQYSGVTNLDSCGV
ncbi:hypothetical protein EMM73_17195 [Rheinheimera sediminis]|uniref:hypothetical protein n=1 Tax=Rheinheimera sp. YQF-1 TaxID=2499626 RepID=UPI000FD89AC9|nr:hypothetical protein [Rheinheimera sp. YQF-1]RVT44189.1 hypothetical protein EMM73_17195 [Rheinheimera sp. YQF-1]